jgi:hypothetical protein
MNELTRENYVIVTRNLGKFYVSKERADKLIELLNSDSCPKILKINDSYPAASDIIGIDSAARIDEVEKEKTGQWKCAQNNWHDKFDKCKCNWGMDTKKREIVIDEKSTPEQKERAQMVGQLREKGWTLKKLVTLKGKTNAEVAEILSKL